MKISQERERTEDVNSTVTQICYLDGELYYTYGLSIEAYAVGFYRGKKNSPTPPTDNSPFKKDPNLFYRNQT